MRVWSSTLADYGECGGKPQLRTYVNKPPVLPHVILLPVASSVMLPAAGLAMSQGSDFSLWSLPSFDSFNVGQTPGAKRREEFRARKWFID
jgi:hypothetical protein